MVSKAVLRPSRVVLAGLAGAALLSALAATLWPAPTAATPTAAAAGPGAVRVPLVAVGGAGGLAAWEFEGALEPQLESTLAAQVSGRLVALPVRAGDRVRAGQVLARLDTRELDAGVAAAEAGVAQARAALTQARQRLERTEALRAQGFVADAALDAARADADAARAALAAAEAGSRQAGVASGHGVVTAPFDGVVRAVHAEAGELAAPGRALLTVYAPGRLRARVWLPLSRADAARDAGEVQVVLGNGRVLVPEKRTELPTADAGSQTVEWRLDLAAADSAALRPGEPVRVRVAAPVSAGAATPAAGVSIPEAALLRRGELVAVYVEQNGRFVLKAVRAGAPVGGRVPVLAGLKPGERIAADAVRAGLAGAVPAP